MRAYNYRLRMATAHVRKANEWLENAQRRLEQLPLGDLPSDRRPLSGGAESEEDLLRQNRELERAQLARLRSQAAVLADQIERHRPTP